jgi:hypothetical protein
MNWRWAMTKPISTGIAVRDAAESWMFHIGSPYASTNWVSAAGAPSSTRPHETSGDAARIYRGAADQSFAEGRAGARHGQVRVIA